MIKVHSAQFYKLTFNSPEWQKSPINLSLGALNRLFVSGFPQERLNPGLLP